MTRATVRQRMEALGLVLGTPRRRLVFGVGALVAVLAYSLLLPFKYTQRLEFANWSYLGVSLAVWSVILGVLFALVLSIQIHAIGAIVTRRAADSALGGVAFLVALLPSFLCCTPIVPTLLAFLGFGGLGLYSTTGAVQHFFATTEPEFLVASAILFLVIGFVGLGQLCCPTCAIEGACATAETLGDEGRDSVGEQPRSAR